MTSTILSNKGFCVTKKEFGVLFKWTLRRNRSLMIVYSIILAVIGPVLNLYAMTVSGGQSAKSEFAAATLMIFVALAALFTLISAVKTFSFLHNKRSVDMFGSLPCNRVTMFLSHLLGGIASVSVPYLAAAIVTMGISAHDLESIKFCISGVMFTLIMIIASYTFTALMAYCCGTVVDTLIVTFAVNIIWVAAVALYYGFLSELIPGGSFETIITTPILAGFAPYAFGYMGMYAHYTESVSIYLLTLIWFVLYTALVFFAAVILANSRKAESSQNGFAVSWLPMFIKAGASVIGGALFGFIFASTSENGFANMFTYAFWYILIGAVAFFVLHIIFARGLKGNYLKSAIVYGCTTVAALSLVFAMCFGLGLDKYVPNANSVKSVSIGYDDVQYSDPETVKLITEIHKVIVEGVREENGYPYYFGSYYTDDYIYDYEYAQNSIKTEERTDVYLAEDQAEKYPYVNAFNFMFEYKMKTGIAVIRDYYISAYNNHYDLEKLNDLCMQFMSSDEYKKKDVSYIFDENERKEYGELLSVSAAHYSNYEADSYSYNYDANASLPTDEKFMKGLYEALQKDILADKKYVSSDYVRSSFNRILGKEYTVISICTEAPYEPGYIYEQQPSIEVCSVIVKNSYANTKKYLNDNNITLNDILYSYGTGYDEYSESIANDLTNFAGTGRYMYLDDLVNCLYYIWADDACEQLDVDVYSWYDYEDDLIDGVNNEARRIYDKIQKDNGYDGIIDIYCPTNDEIQEMLVNIQLYVYEYIARQNGKSIASDIDVSSDVTDNDKQSDTDTDSKSDTDKTSSNDSSKTSDNASSNENSKSSDSNSKNNASQDKQTDSSAKTESKDELTSEKSVAA